MAVEIEYRGDCLYRIPQKYEARVYFLEAKASKGMHQVSMEKSPDRHYPYIRAENNSTDCTSIHRGFYKML